MAEAGATPEARVLGRYALYGEIAAGGMATVHFGRLLGPVGFSRTVAIKRLHPQYAKDPEFVSMFLDEARLAARIQHPNVVATLDVVATEGELFLVMEYVPGESLSKLIRAACKRDTRVPPRIVSAIGSGVLHGLHAAHEAKSERGEPLSIVHRDVSPQNVLVGSDGTARVLDFGVAKATMRAQSTRDGQMKGKMSYMAPEQVGGKGTDRRTDVFAAGVVIWEALTGKRLFDGSDAGEVLGRVMTMEIPPPSVIVPTLPRTLDKVVLKGLERDLGKRYATAREFAIALEKAAPLATPREVGEWVELVGGDTLSKRERQVADIESVSSESVRPLPAVGLPSRGSRSDAGAEARAAVAGEPSPSAEPSTSPSNVSQVSVASQPTMASQVSNVTLSNRPGAPFSARRQRGLLALVVAATFVSLVGVAAAVLLLRSRRQDVERRSVASPEAASASAAAVPLQPVDVESLQVETVVSDAAAEAAGRVDGGRLAEVGTEKPPAKTVRRKSGGTSPARPAFGNRKKLPAKARTKAKSAGKVDCSTPYWVDAKGVRRLKPQCL